MGTADGCRALSRSPTTNHHYQSVWSSPQGLYVLARPPAGMATVHERISELMRSSKGALNAAALEERGAHSYHSQLREVPRDEVRRLLTNLERHPSRGDINLFRSEILAHRGRTYSSVTARNAGNHAVKRPSLLPLPAKGADTEA